MQDDRPPFDSLPRHLKASDHRRMRWKNGAGETVEIAVFPPQADLATFGWRISMATVASDGPFSVFDGVDRTLSILEGNGMELDINGLKPALLTQMSEPLFFPADKTTVARLVSGPIVDLNVMTRRNQWSHHVQRRTFEGRERMDAGCDIGILLSLGHLRLETAGHKIELVKLDCVVFDGELIAISDSIARAYFIRIKAA